MGDKKIRNMEEFAAAVGVSRPTVSKYFNDPLSVRRTTRTRIEQALEEANGHVGKAAEILGISRATLWRKRKRYNL